MSKDPTSVPIASFTGSAADHPEYISVNEVDGLVEVATRAPKDLWGAGAIAAIRLRPEEMVAFRELVAWSAKRQRPAEPPAVEAEKVPA